MLAANKRASRLSHVASFAGYSKPTPGPLMMKFNAGTKVAYG